MEPARTQTNMITHSHKKLFDLLDKHQLNNAQTIQNPIVRVDLGDGSPPLTFGGDVCIVHYNRQKEIAHSTRKIQKRFRHLRRQEKNARCRTGDILPSSVTLLNWEGEPIR